MSSQEAITADQSLASLAVSRAGASRVFHRHGLDFCCHGHTSLQTACQDAGLAVDALIEEIQSEREAAEASFTRMDEAPLDKLIDHILEQFHQRHRADLPRLIEMARKVENVHGEKVSCPIGLTTHLEYMLSELEQHMQKEEEILFPLIRSGCGSMATMPIQVMEQEHKDHGQNLTLLRQLSHGFEPPPEACGTWRALYLGLAEFEQEIMLHISLENNVLFPRALRG